MISIKGIIDKVASRKLGVTAVAGAAATTGAVEVTWPIAAIAMAYILGQTGWIRGGRETRDGAKKLGEQPFRLPYIF